MSQQDAPTQSEATLGQTTENETIQQDDLRFEAEKYADAIEVWPQRGQHILAQFTDDAILVYQAYKQDIGEYALSNQCFEGCGGFSLSRMTWIKTNFLWMMYRSGWGKKHNQRVVLGIWLKRSFFEDVLRHAKNTQPKDRVRGGRTEVDSDDEGVAASSGKKRLNQPCRLQWDPDHLPDGSSHVSRRAIQIGIKGEWATRFASADRDVSPILRIVDVTPFVRDQARILDGAKRSAKKQMHKSELMVARERVYRGLPSALATGIGVWAESA